MVAGSGGGRRRWGGVAGRHCLGGRAVEPRRSRLIRLCAKPGASAAPSPARPLAPSTRKVLTARGARANHQIRLGARPCRARSKETYMATAPMHARHRNSLTLPSEQPPSPFGTDEPARGASGRCMGDTLRPLHGGCLQLNARCMNVHLCMRLTPAWAPAGTPRPRQPDGRRCTCVLARPRARPALPPARRGGRACAVRGQPAL